MTWQIEFSSVEYIDQAQSIVEGEQVLNEGRKYDPIISDIRLADGLSFDLLKKMDSNIPIIFTTAYDQYALDASAYNGVDYVLKPINEDKLVQSIQKVNQWIVDGLKESFAKSRRYQFSGAGIS